MANSFNKGRIYIDGTSPTQQVVATDRRIKIAYVLFVPNAGNDQCVIKESSSGAVVLKLSSATAKAQEFLDFSANPIVVDGVYVDSISASAVAILYTTSEGAK